MTRALLIRNPVARHRLSDVELAAIQVTADAAGWQLETVATARAGDATDLARQAAERGTEIVIVHGGDGTLNEVINGLTHTETAVAVLRGGTANVWAKETGTHKDPVQAMRAIVAGERRRIDLGRANGRYFVLMCGLGLDGAIVDRVGKRMKQRFGALAYIVAGVRTALGTKPWAANVDIDGTPAETALFWLLAGNTRSYGGVVQLTHRALIDDGLLDIAIMQRGNALRLLRDGLLVLLSRHERSPNVAYTRSARIEITTPAIPYQLDGEPCGYSPLTIECVPRALTVITPRTLTSPLFTP
jgi:YegS/Rv2252/BmrU family lipid kinase